MQNQREYALYVALRKLLKEQAPEVKGAVIMLHRPDGISVNLLTCESDNDEEIHVGEANTLIAAGPKAIEEWAKQMVALGGAQ